MTPAGQIAAVSEGIPKWVWGVAIGGVVLIVGVVAWPLISGLGSITGAAGKVLDLAADVVEGTIEGLKDAAKALKEVVKEAWEGLKEFLKWLGEKFKKLFALVGNAVEKCWRAVSNAGTWVWKHTLGNLF